MYLHTKYVCICSLFFFRKVLKVEIMSTTVLRRGSLLVWFLVHACFSVSEASANYVNNFPGNGIIQNPVVSCQDVKKKILCLPLEYSKFDLPYRNEHNLIDIGKYHGGYTPSS